MSSNRNLGSVISNMRYRALMRTVRAKVSRETANKRKKENKALEGIRALYSPAEAKKLSRKRRKQTKEA